MKLNMNLNDVLQGDPSGDGSYDIVTAMSVIGVKDEETPPPTVEVNDVTFTLAGRVIDNDETSLYWSYWNDNDPAVNLQLWFS